jgi:hypothetical protein
MAARLKDEWYYHQNDVTHGPVPFKALRRLAASGVLRPDDKVWSAALQEWVVASAVPKLVARKKKPAARGVRTDTGEQTGLSTSSHLPGWFKQVLWVMVAILGVVAWYAGKEAGYKEGERKGYELGKAEGQALGNSEGFQRGVEYTAKLSRPHDAKGGTLTSSPVGP